MAPWLLSSLELDIKSYEKYILLLKWNAYKNQKERNLDNFLE